MYSTSSQFNLDGITVTMAINMQLVVVLDGTDVFQKSVKSPVFNSLNEKTQYYLAGGAVSAHTHKKHLSLVCADNVTLEWKLSSLSVLNGG